MTPTTEDRIRRGLGGIGAAAHAPDQPQALVHLRLQQRRRRRRSRALAAAGVVSLVLVVAGAGIVTQDDRTSVDAAGGPGIEAPPVDSSAASAGFPNVSIELPDLELGYVDVRTQKSPTQGGGSVHVQVFRPTGSAWSLPVLQVMTGSGEHLGIGRENPDAQVVDIDGVDGYFDVRGEMTTLGWELADGTQTLLLARGFQPDDVLAAATSMVKRPDGPGWDLPSIVTLGLTQSTEGSTQLPEGELEFHTLQFASASGGVELNSYTATQADHESRVIDYLTAGDVVIENTTALGLPAVIARSAQDVRVLWYDPERRVSTYLIIDGDFTDRVDDVLSGLVMLDDDGWKALIERAPSSGQGDPGHSSPTTVAPPSADTISGVESAIKRALPDLDNALEITNTPAAIAFRVTGVDTERTFTLAVYAPAQFDDSEMELLQQVSENERGTAWLGADDEDLRSLYFHSSTGAAVRVESTGTNASELRSIDELIRLADELAHDPAVTTLMAEMDG